MKAKNLVYAVFGLNSWNIVAESEVKGGVLHSPSPHREIRVMSRYRYLKGPNRSDLDDLDRIAPRPADYKPTCRDWTWATFTAASELYQARTADVPQT